MSIALLIVGILTAVGGFLFSSAGILVAGAVLFVGGAILDELGHIRRLLKDIKSESERSNGWHARADALLESMEKRKRESGE